MAKEIVLTVGDPERKQKRFVSAVLQEGDTIENVKRILRSVADAL